jgi:hypothetical protein
MDHPNDEAVCTNISLDCFCDACISIVRPRCLLSFACELPETLQVAEFLADTDMVAGISASLARDLRMAVRLCFDGSPDELLAALPSLQSDAKLDKSATILALLNALEDCTLEDVFQHVHLSEALHCPERFQKLALQSRIKQGTAALDGALAGRMTSTGDIPSCFSDYADHIQHLKVRFAPAQRPSKCSLVSGCSGEHCATHASQHPETSTTSSCLYGNAREKLP